MPTQPSTVTDTLTGLNSRVTALESTSIDDSQPVDLFHSFSENGVCNDAFTISTHLYHVCQGYVFVGQGQIEATLPCNTTLII